jgi:hypothetical protein
MLVRSGPPTMHEPGFAAVASSLLAAALVLPIDAPPLSLFVCPVRAATGLPCLTCGCTHAFASFVRGQFLEALLASPLGALLALACTLHLGLTAARLCGLRWAPAMPRLAGARPRLLVAGAVLANWAFLVTRS